MEACPKCNFMLAPETVECPACGVILAKLKAITGLQRQIRPVAAATLSNPYAPPVAEVEGPSVPPPPLPVVSPPAQDVITRPTLEALSVMRPWMRFFTLCGLAINTLTLLGALGLLFWSSDKPGLMPIALVYLLISGVGFAILSPLNRSTAALGHLAVQGVSHCLETFAVEQATFWRRMGALCIAYLIIVVIAVVVGGLAGITMSR